MSKEVSKPTDRDVGNGRKCFANSSVGAAGRQKMSQDEMSSSWRGVTDVAAGNEQPAPTADKEEKRARRRDRFDHMRESAVVNLLFSLLVPLITILTTEWIARGTLGANRYGNGFFESLISHLPSFIIAYFLLIFVYIFISQLTGRHAIATLVVGLVGNVPATVTYFKLTMRGEPFLPWDLMQIGDLLMMKGDIKYSIQPSMVLTIVIFTVLAVLAHFVMVPRKKNKKPDWIMRLSMAGISLVLAVALVFGIFLRTASTEALFIYADMWMQDRYYRNHGVLTGFLTNLQVLDLEKPDGYNETAVRSLEQQIQQNMQSQTPFFPGCYADTASNIVQQPDIIFLMAESFWDVTQLEGVEYDQPLLTNLEALKEEGAFGYGYTPSFGGGTCDVEFEALTGFSMEHLPAGSKPFQQYVTQDTFSLPHYLKTQGYSTLAIHGYGRRFWNRDVAYPRLGIDRFVAKDDIYQPTYRRNYISDDSMVNHILLEQQSAPADTPMFIHAVTMQNHTTYSPDKYPAEDLVRVVEAPEGMPKKTVGELEDCATGIREMDAALGKLVEALRETDRPTILVFWGDHLNPMSDGYAMFEETGFIEEGDTESPRLHQVPLLMWSNYADNQIDLGTIATYQISPVMFDLFGLQPPAIFYFLSQNLGVMRARTRGVTANPDGSFGLEMNADQQKMFDQHAMLQYDLLFGERYLEDYTSVPEAPS